MTLTEAIHVQALLAWLTDPHQDGDHHTAAACESAAVLADAARRRLGVGPTGAQITAGWADLLTGCPGCPICRPAP